MKKTLKLDREVVTTDYNGGGLPTADEMMLDVIIGAISAKTGPACFWASVFSYVTYTEVTAIGTCINTLCDECATNFTCQASCYQSACVGCYSEYNRVAGCSGGGYC